jgi:hypothetical protein
VNGEKTTYAMKDLHKAILTEELLTVAQVCSRLPGARSNRRVSPSTVTRWVLNGCPSRGGVRIKLKATRAGGRWLIAPADLDSFFAALADTNSDEDVSTAPKARTDEQRRKASERAARELERRGA